jgi:hypothetical protein
VAVEFNIEGQNYRFPDWATQSTMEEISKVLQEIAKNNGVSDKQIKALVDNNKKMHQQMTKDAKEEKKSDKERAESEKQQAGFFKQMIRGLKDTEDAVTDSNKVDKKEYKTFASKVIGDFEHTGEQLVGAVGMVSWQLGKAGLALGGLFMAGLGIVGKALHGAGGAINDLTKSGIGFSSTYDDVGMATTQAIGNLGALGDGFAGAANRMAQSSSVIATQGFGRFTDTMKFAADTSEDLGMSFSDSMDRFGDALARRQKMMNLGNIDQGKLNTQVARTTRMQQAYATAIGVSTETLTAFVDELTGSTMLMSSMLKFNDQARSDLLGGIEVFASGMAAMGGPAGQDIAHAFTEAASMGSMGLSEAAIGMVTALPNLKGPMDEYISAVQSGTLSQDQAQGMVEGLTNQLGNLGQAEKQRIFLLARTGDESAKMMAQAITQFEQSEDKIKDINKALGTGFKMDLVQKGTNEFNKVMAQISGGAQNAFYSLFSDPGVTKAMTDGFKEILGVFGFAIDDLSGGAQSMGDRVKGLAKAMIPTIKMVAEQLKIFAEYLRDTFKEGGISGLISDLMSRAAGVVVKALFKGLLVFGTLIFAASAAKMAFTTYVMPAAIGFAKTMFSKAGAIAKQVGNIALGFAKTLMDSKTAKGAAGYLSTASAAIGKKASGAAEWVGGTGVGKKVSGWGGTAADKLKSFEKTGSGMTDKLSGSMTKGGKSGGFLKSIADGVKKFGDNKTVKGAASLALLGAAVVLAATGLKQFNDVDFRAVVIGTGAMFGLAQVAKVLGKGSTAMIKGAAAMFILGASIVPLAFGLNMMKDVGLGTIVTLAAGIIVLGAAAAILSFVAPFIITGAVAIGILGLALIPLGIAMQLVAGPLDSFGPSLSKLADVDGAGLAGTAGGLLALGGAMAIMGAMLPFMLLAALSIPIIYSMAGALQEFDKINMKNLAIVGIAMKSIGEGMSAISGGSLMSSLKDGIGSLFGADSPVDKIKSFVDGLGDISMEPLLFMATGFSLLQDSIKTLPMTLLKTMFQLKKMEEVFLLLSKSTVHIMRFGSRIGKFAINMKFVGDSFEKMGDNPFAIFEGVEAHAKNVEYFATSQTQLNDALNGFMEVDTDQFFIMGDGIAYLAEQISKINFTDMLKIAAISIMAPKGPSADGPEKVAGMSENTPKTTTQIAKAKEQSAPLVQTAVDKPVESNDPSYGIYGSLKIAETSLADLEKKIAKAQAAVDAYNDSSGRREQMGLPEWDEGELESLKFDVIGAKLDVQSKKAKLQKSKPAPYSGQSDYAPETAQAYYDRTGKDELPEGWTRDKNGMPKSQPKTTTGTAVAKLQATDTTDPSDVGPDVKPKPGASPDTLRDITSPFDSADAKAAVLLEQMIALQTENNRLTKLTIKATKDLDA